MRVPFRGIAEVEDPVQASPEDEDHVGFFEGGTSRTGSIQRMRVR